MHANKREEIDEVFAGDIAAVVGLKAVATGDTLCDPRKPIQLESLQFPEPVISIAIEPKTQADMDRLGQSLDRLAQEDPSFRCSVDPETGQTIISGMGELHLEIIADRLLREFNVQANVGAPQVAYKETITRPVSVVGRYVKQTGGSGDFAIVSLEVEPGKPGSGFAFVDAVKGGAVPREFISVGAPWLRGGHPERLAGRLPGGRRGGAPGRRAGRTTCDSSERSFKIAGSIGMKEALETGGPVLLEPIMSVEVVVPDEFVGPVQGDLNSRRGDINGFESRGNAQVITAEVPLASMFGYVNSLRSMTQGRGTYTMQFQRYARVPEGVAQAVAYH